MAESELRGEKLAVFLSYSRKDLAFVDRLLAALEARDVDVKVDREDIEKGEAWWARIQQLITEADTIVFVLSPDSVASSICQDEVDFADRLNKRFVPIVARQLGDNLVPAALGRLNYLFFIPNAATGANGDFDEAVDLLTRALQTDIGWIREHTRLGSLAVRWESRNRPSELLLRGAELSTAETWLTTRPNKAPNPTDAHRALLTESRRAATWRQRVVVGLSVTAALLAIILSGLAYWQRGLALLNEARARKERDTALIAQSRLFADMATQHVGRRECTTAMLLSLLVLPDKSKAPNGAELSNRPLVAEARDSLFKAYFSDCDRPKGGASIATTSEVRNLSANPGGTNFAIAEDKTVRVWSLAAQANSTYFQNHCQTHVNRPGRSVDCMVLRASFSSDGSMIASAAADDTARIWDTKSGTEQNIFSHEDWVWDARFSSDNSRIATASRDKTARMWDAVSGKLMTVFRGHEQTVFTVDIDRSGTRVATASLDKTARIWNAASGELLHVLRGHNEAVDTARFSHDGKLVLTGSRDGTARIWNATTGEELRLIGNGGPVRNAVFSRDDKVILTVSGNAVTEADETAEIWDAASGEQLASMGNDDKVIKWAEFGNDSRIVWIDNNGNIGTTRTQFDTDQDLIDEAKRNVGRCLSTEELVRFRMLPEPPRWCITGAGLELEKDPTKWMPKSPYDRNEWRDWLAGIDMGITPPRPSEHRR